MALGSSFSGETLAAEVNGKLDKTGGTMTGNIDMGINNITGLNMDFEDPTCAVNKAYVDSHIEPWVAGDNIIFYDKAGAVCVLIVGEPNVYTDTGISYVSNNNGTIKVSVRFAPWQHYYNNSISYPPRVTTNAIGYLKFKVNGELYDASEYTANGNWTTVSITLSVNAGDIISFDGKSSFPSEVNWYYGIKIDWVTFGIADISRTIVKTPINEV